jgi:hypothetical protein
MWRVVTFLILSFWLLMTGLLVEKVYFRKGLRQPVSLQHVLDRGTEAVGATESMDLLYQGALRGRAGVRVQRWFGDEATPAGGYLLDCSGTIDGLPTSQIPSMNWHSVGRLDRMLQWQSIYLRGRVMDTDTSFIIEWSRSVGKPIVEVRRSGQLIMDMAAIEQQAELLKKIPGLPLPSLPGLPSLGEAAKAEGALSESVKLEATAGQYELAGEMRDCFYISGSALGLYKAEALFTEAGELAKIDLPNGWRLTNPVVGVLQGK